VSQAWIVVGMGFGDESKGATTDALCRTLPVDLIVRHGGGGQAAHNVITPDGRHHTFSQFGSGSMANDTVRTHLSRFMLVDPVSMMNEAMSLPAYNIWNRTTIDENAIIVTPIHKMINRNREDIRDAIGEGRHGSCGMGIGVAREVEINHPELAMRVKDLTLDQEELRHKIYKLYDFFEKELDQVVSNRQACMMQANAWLAQMSLFPKRIIVPSMPSFECSVFEGAQGVMLDEKHGTAPHNTWTNTTFENADKLLDEAGVGDRTRIGCIRTYYTRHGAGPFPTEREGWLEKFPEPHNGTGRYQGAFRVGEFDWNLFEKAIDIVGGVDLLSVSHLDRIPSVYAKPFLERIGNYAPVGMKARGATAAHRKVELGVYA